MKEMNCWPERVIINEDKIRNLHRKDRKKNIVFTQKYSWSIRIHPDYPLAAAFMEDKTIYSNYIIESDDAIYMISHEDALRYRFRNKDWEDKHHLPAQWLIPVKYWTKDGVAPGEKAQGVFDYAK